MTLEANPETILTRKDGPVAEQRANNPASPVVLVCEHASNSLPVSLDRLGVGEDVLASHIAWDPGALAVADAMALRLDASLIAARFSRLVYDLNRPPDSLQAICAVSERYDIPGNAGLDPAARQKRSREFYEPFHAMLGDMLAARGSSSVLVTVHSFTPIYFDKRRETELGILHDADSRLADAMLALAPHLCSLRAERNEPYGPEDGVTHTLVKHAMDRNLLNVMLEIRSDLIGETASQRKIAGELSRLVEAALEQLGKADAA